MHITMLAARPVTVRAIEHSANFFSGEGSSILWTPASDPPMRRLSSSFQSFNFEAA